MPKQRHKSKTLFIAYVAASIDGKISLVKRVRPDWTSKEDWKFYQDALAKADAVVVGRNTYEAAKERLKKRTAFVFTSRVTIPKKIGSITFVNPARTNLAQLFQDFKNVAVIGGAEVYQTMLDDGMLDELYVTIEPLLFGRGREMFVGGTKTFHTKLESVRKLNRHGTLLLHYKILR